MATDIPIPVPAHLLTAGSVYRIAETGSEFTYHGVVDGRHHLTWAGASYSTTRSKADFAHLTICEVR